MKYTIIITETISNTTSTLSGELTAKDHLLQKALLHQKRLVCVNPQDNKGSEYKIILEKKNKVVREFLFDDTSISNNIQQLLTKARANSTVS